MFREGREAFVCGFPQIWLDVFLEWDRIKMCIVMHKKHLFCAFKTMDKIKAKEIILEQKKEIRNILKGRIIEREIEREVERSFKDDLIKVIISGLLF